MARREFSWKMWKDFYTKNKGVWKTRVLVDEFSGTVSQAREELLKLFPLDECALVEIEGGETGMLAYIPLCAFCRKPLKEVDNCKRHREGIFCTIDSAYSIDRSDSPPAYKCPDCWRPVIGKMPDLTEKQKEIFLMVAGTGHINAGISAKDRRLMQGELIRRRKIARRLVKKGLAEEQDPIEFDLTCLGNAVFKLLSISNEKRDSKNIWAVSSQL